MNDDHAFQIDIFADGANLDSILELDSNPLISGFTTNPTLMRQCGVTDYEQFSRRVLEYIDSKPVSLEVFCDDLPGMLQQAREIASWGPNVYVKIPVSTTRGQFTGPVIQELARDGIQLNVTAVLQIEQVQQVSAALAIDTPAIVSVFAGRIADTGRDPIPLMRAAAEVLSHLPHARLLWASPREVLNIYQAEAIGCDIITVTPDLLRKLSLRGKCLESFSRETVAMFYRDACAAGYSIHTRSTGSQTISTQSIHNAGVQEVEA